jgi:hypothetical protein
MVKARATMWQDWDEELKRVDEIERDMTTPDGNGRPQRSEPEAAVLNQCVSAIDRTKKQNRVVAWFRHLKLAIDSAHGPHPTQAVAPGGDEEEMGYSDEAGRNPDFHDHFSHNAVMLKLKDRGSMGKVMDSAGAMVLDRVKLNDVNGLLGRQHRHPLTGVPYVKEVESWRDFHLVDLWTRPQIAGMPDDHVRDKNLFKPVPLDRRTFIYHSKFREAYAKHRVGLETEGFLFESLATRCIDAPVADGSFSPVVVFLPLLPISLLTGDSTMFVFTAFMALWLLIVALATNDYKLAGWSRTISLPSRLVFLMFTVAKVGGSGVQTLGYVTVILACVADLLMGDITQLTSMRLNCHYEVVRALPNQLFICYRIGDNEVLSLKTNRGNRPIPPQVTGMNDPGDGSLCLIANIQGLLIELVPVCEEDVLQFHEEQENRAGTDLGRVRYFGVDLFCSTMKTVADIDASKEKGDPLKQLLKHKEPRAASKNKKGGTNDLRVEDFP